MPKKRAFRRMPRPLVTQPSDLSYKIIALTREQFAKVDTADYLWLNQWNWHALWDPKTHSFYAVRWKRKEKRILVYMAREIVGCNSGEEADHKNHDTLDNRRENLRKATHTQNLCNRRIRRDNRSGYPGISWHKRDRKWYVRIRDNGKLISLGYFDSLEEAARVRDEAAKKYHGEFAQLNLEEK